MKIKLTSIIINSIADQLCSDLDPVCFCLSQCCVFVSFALPPPLLPLNPIWRLELRRSPSQASFLITTGVGWNRRTTRTER